MFGYPNKELLKIVFSWFKKVLFQLIGGLFMEKKDDLWVVSKGNVAFWIIMTHCMFVWNKILSTPSTSTDVVNSIVQSVTHLDVSQGELYTLWLLLGYSGVKIGASAAKDVVSTWKGGNPQDGGSK